VSPRRRRPVSSVIVAAALVGLLALAIGSGSLEPVAHGATLAPCSTYPVPGTVAPQGSSVPSAIRARYALFGRGQRADEGFALGKLQSPLPASGVVPSGTRLVGRAGDRGLLYAIPAEHFLPYRIAPPRCLSASERQVERYLLPSLRRDYAQPAVCLVEVGGDDPVGTPLENCAGLSGAPDALLATGATPLLGLAPDGVTSVTVRFLSARPRTIRVRHNFYELVAPRLAVTPCGVEWLDSSGSVGKSIGSCNYLPAEVGPLLAYRGYVTEQLSTVQSDVSALARAVGAGNAVQAESEWLSAHLAWLDIGQDDGAYACFGELGGEIDGTAAGLVGGTGSPQFTGFHKIELDLWTDGNLAAAQADTATLQQLLTKLVAVPLPTELPTTQTGAANWVLRPHEILEDAMRDTLTGDDDYGSGTGLASITADVSATENLLGLLAPALDPLAPHLVARARGQLSAVLTAVDEGEINGAWVAVSGLSTATRERVDAAVGAVLETLAPIPDLLSSTGHAAPLT
jgi:hypothetical protein